MGSNRAAARLFARIFAAGRPSGARRAGGAIAGRPSGGRRCRCSHWRGGIAQSEAQERRPHPGIEEARFQSKIYNTCFQCYINALYQIRSCQAVPNDDCILPAERMAAIEEVQEKRLRIAKQRAEKGERPEKQPKARKAMKVTARTSMKGKAHGARGRPGKIAKH